MVKKRGDKFLNLFYRIPHHTCDCTMQNINSFWEIFSLAWRALNLMTNKIRTCVCNTNTEYLTQYWIIEQCTRVVHNQVITTRWSTLTLKKTFTMLIAWYILLGHDIDTTDRCHFNWKHYRNLVVLWALISAELWNTYFYSFVRICHMVD